MIRLCWVWMKRRATKRGVPSPRKTTESVEEAFEESVPKADTSMDRAYSSEIIGLKGGNQYQEGREDPVYGLEPS
jgi:hypothetical protein